MMLAVPLCFLYELGIILAIFAVKTPTENTVQSGTA
jgi:Sec-independent protein secretion pathway component TatC